MTLTAWHCAMALALGALLPAAHAQTPWTPVDACELAAMRGGVASTSALQVAIGIARQVSINGEVVASTSIELDDLAQLTASRSLYSGVGNGFQSGPGNSYQAALSNQAWGASVIQNSLSDQRIATQTTINASVNSVAMIKSLNFQATLSDALARAASLP